MGARHPLPYAYAKAHTLLLEDDGARLVLWAPENVALPALSEVLRLYEVDGFERESAETLTSRIAAAYAGGESSAAVVVGEVESAVDLSRMMQELPAIEDLLEASNDAPSFAAWVSRALSMRMIGASLLASSRSSIAGSSCIIRDRSTALSTSPTTTAALDSPPA